VAERKPNIIFVMADQLRLSACGYAGDQKAHTPNIDTLAGESANFQNAVVSMPVCAACRASLFTGKYATSTGMVINELRMNTHHRALAHCLTDGGYTTGYIGKWHLWANELGNHDDPKNSYIPPGPDRLGFDGHWAAYNFHHTYFDTYYHTDSPEPIRYGDGVYEPDGQTDMAIDFIREHAGAAEPFALVLSWGTPHNPWGRDNVPDEFYRMFAQVEFPVAPNYQDAPDEPYGDQWANQPRTVAEVERWKRVYYAMAANLDWNVGRLQEAIRQSGIEGDTIFVFTSDHGEMFGAHGRMGKNIFYEEAARVPFLLKWPGHAPAGSRPDVCLSCVDVMPTLLGLAGLDIPSEVEGMDLSHCACGQDGPEPDAAFLQNTGACALWEDGHEWRALRDKRFTYAVYRVDGAELLFDNIEDPSQRDNLIDRPAFAPEADRFRKMLAEKMTSLNDAFPPSSWYKDNWISEDRIILRTATFSEDTRL